MNSVAFDEVGRSLFRSGGWCSPTLQRRRITQEEKELLERIAQDPPSRTMPPGSVPNPTKRKVRPSSAAAKLQSHPSFQSGLYSNNNRPSTATASDFPPGLGSRPKTQAGGPRYQWGSSSLGQISEAPRQQQRRLTVAAVDGIAETDAASRKGHVSTSVAALLNDKVKDFRLL